MRFLTEFDVKERTYLRFVYSTKKTTVTITKYMYDVEELSIEGPFKRLIQGRINHMKEVPEIKTCVIQRNVHWILFLVYSTTDIQYFDHYGELIIE